MTKLEKNKLFAAVIELGLGGQFMSLDQQFHGGQCVVYKLSFFPDNSASSAPETVAVRVPKDGGLECIPALETEWSTLQMLQEKGFEWSPKPLGRSLTLDNPIRRPFLVLTWAHGTTCSWSPEFPPLNLREKFLGQLAMIHSRLVNCTFENSTTTWESFFQTLSLERRIRVLEDEIPDLSVNDCDDQMDFLPRALTINGDDASQETKMAMDHGDLKLDNIIVDDDYNITCIIDWGLSAMVPLPRASCLPRFLWGPGLVPTTRWDREFYVDCFSRPEYEGLPIFVFLSDHDADFRTLYMESLFSENIHRLMAHTQWRVLSSRRVTTWE